MPQYDYVGYAFRRIFFIAITYLEGEEFMDNRIALIGIIVESEGNDSIDRLNDILHAYGKVIIGRMGIPYREKGVNIISIVVDAPNDVVSSLAGKIGALKNVSVKTMVAKR
jgi:putative iron-only hydrogenase system regulator